MTDRSEYIDLFNRMHPGYFEHDFIRNMPDDLVYEEMLLDLHGFSADDVKIDVPESVTFGFFSGDIADLRRAVAEVDDGWVKYYNDPSHAYCAFADGRVVSFCDVDEMGSFPFRGGTAKIGGPGCVGTVPAWRRRGVGLKMVQGATQILKERGFDYSYIHYTGVGPWYAKLGYRVILRWNGKGFTE